MEFNLGIGELVSVIGLLLTFVGSIIKLYVDKQKDHSAIEVLKKELEYIKGRSDNDSDKIDNRLANIHRSILDLNEETKLQGQRIGLLVKEQDNMKNDMQNLSTLSTELSQQMISSNERTSDKFTHLKERIDDTTGFINAKLSEMAQNIVTLKTQNSK